MSKDFQRTIRAKLESKQRELGTRELTPELQVSKAILEARGRLGMTQDDLAQATGIKQAAISRLENCCSNPSLRTLKRIAGGLGLKLQIRFVEPDTP